MTTEAVENEPLKLASRFKLRDLDLRNRVVLAPMTRMRTSQPGDIPSDMMAEYYAQRAEAGLLIAEATQISRSAQGYSHTPGIYSPEQVAGWCKVTRAVHESGGKIFLQLWHVGRMSHESFHGGERPVAPSAISPDARVFIVDGDNPEGAMVECPTPRALEETEIVEIVYDFRRAARRAIEAGFDGVEIHGANGYLLDQFIRKTSNLRDDHFGGTLENRVRFPLEVAKAIVEEIGSARTAMRVAPHIKERGMDDEEAPEAILHLAKQLHDLELAYLHLVEADWDDAPKIPFEYRIELRNAFPGPIIAAGNYDFEKAESLLARGVIDLVAFGRPFIANPDLPSRLVNHLPLRDYDPGKLYGGGRAGYIY